MPARDEPSGGADSEPMWGMVWQPLGMVHGAGAERNVQAEDVQAVDVLVRGGDVVTMDGARTVVRDGAVAVHGDIIVAVEPWDQLRARHPEARVIGDADSLVTPGYVNAHQHLTGDRLVHSCIPDAIDSQEAIFGWAVPVHAAHTGDDDELSATLGCDRGRHQRHHVHRRGGHRGPPRPRGRGGRRRWGCGRRSVSGDGTSMACRSARRPPRCSTGSRDLLDRLPAGRTRGGLGDARRPRPDERRAGRRCQRPGTRPRGVGPDVPHVAARRRPGQLPGTRTGRRPFVHLDELGVLGPHVLVAHAVHLDDDELDVVVRTDTAVASCPWAYLRLAQGFTVAGRHGELLRPRRAGGAGMRRRERRRRRRRPARRRRCSSVSPATAPSTRSASRPTTGWRWPRSAAPEAIGKGDAIGSIEVGKQADLVVHDRRGPQFVPRSTDPCCS